MSRKYVCCYNTVSSISVMNSIPNYWLWYIAANAWSWLPTCRISVIKIWSPSPTTSCKRVLETYHNAHSFTSHITSIQQRLGQIEGRICNFTFVIMVGSKGTPGRLPRALEKAASNIKWCYLGLFPSKWFICKSFLYLKGCNVTIYFILNSFLKVENFLSFNIIKSPT